MGDVAFVPADTVKPKKCEPILMGKPVIDHILMGDTVLPFKQTKNVKADPGDCDKKTYY